jgi:hypothetical protein
MAQKRRMSTAGPTLEEIWFVLTDKDGRRGSVQRSVRYY